MYREFTFNLADVLMLRLVSVSLFAGVLLAATPVAAQEQPAPQQPAPEQPAPQQGAPDQAAPQQGAPQGGAASLGNQFCGKDLQPMLAKRDQLGKQLQAINKRPRPKTFEQAKKTFNEFCGGLSSYIANDKKMIDYMSSNKDFCGITDQNIQQMTQDMTQVQATRTKICSHPPRQQAAPAPKGGGGPAAPKPPVNLRLQ
jgi:hypothetical protein